MSTTSLRALVVEDNQSWQQILSEILSDCASRARSRAGRHWPRPGCHRRSARLRGCRHCESPDCASDGRDAAESLRIEGINAGTTLARAPGSERGVQLVLRALGSESRLQWLLDGRSIAETRGRQGFSHDFETPGQHTLTVIADSGAWHSVDFSVLR